MAHDFLRLDYPLAEALWDGDKCYPHIHGRIRIRSSVSPVDDGPSRRRKAIEGLQEFSTTAMQRFLRRKISDPKLARGG